MFLHEFLHLTHNLDNLLTYLCDKKVILCQIKCPKCKNVVQQQTANHNLMFHCTNKHYKVTHKKRQRVTCNFKLSMLHGTWFAHFKLGLQKACRFIGYFIIMKQPSQFFLEQELQMSSESVVDWKNYCRELLSMWLMKNNTKIGGPGHIVEVDEAKIGKRKYNRGRIVRGQWVFGGFERETKHVFVVPVPDRSETTLLDIIRCRIAPGTTIYTDCWRGYSNLKKNGFDHFTVNHSENFVDPVTGVHTQNIERLWRDMRGAIPRYGIKEYHYNYYIVEFLFKRLYTYSDRIDKFFEIMAEMYPLNN